MSSFVREPSGDAGTQRSRRVVAYRTRLGTAYCGTAENLLLKHPLTINRGRVQLIFTSPPFPLNRKKKYGNLNGKQYIEWLASFASLFREYLKPDGSIVLELGNAWEPGKPTMSTLTLRALLAFLEQGRFQLCQEFVCFNPARLPSPAQWVNVERIRVKDSFTRLWWMSPVERPKADNRKVLQEYSASMHRLLQHQHYNSGRRPSQHTIGEQSFLKNNGGSIPPNVLVSVPGNFLTMANTGANDEYQEFCRNEGLVAHPARMPIPLPTFFIRLLSDKGDLVMDPFAGSNTTGRAAQSLMRRWVSIEARTDYVRGSLGRFRSAKAIGAQLASST